MVVVLQIQMVLVSQVQVVLLQRTPWSIRPVCWYWDGSLFCRGMTCVWIWGSRILNSMYGCFVLYHERKIVLKKEILVENRELIHMHIVPVKLDYDDTTSSLIFVQMDFIITINIIMMKKVD